MPSSIITDNMSECFICHAGGTLEIHHCLHGTANRKNADKEKLIVPLCHSCHTAVHDSGDRDMDLFLMRKAEIAWIKEHDSNIEGFIEIFGKNYL